MAHTVYDHLNFTRHCKLALLSSCTNLHYPQQHIESSFLSILTPTLNIVMFFTCQSHYWVSFKGWMKAGLYKHFFIWEAQVKWEISPIIVFMAACAIPESLGKCNKERTEALWRHSSEESQESLEQS